MAKKEWTPREFELALKAKLEELGTSVVWGKPKGRQRTPTIGAIFVPRDPPARE